MASGTFEVQVVDRQTGKESWVRVVAESREDAKKRVIDLGEIAGDARLVEVTATTSAVPVATGGDGCEEPSPAASMSDSSSTPKCRVCSGTVAMSARSCPHCGARMPGVSNEYYYFTIACYVIVVIISAIGLVVVATS